MTETQEEIEAHNSRELWRDVTTNLAVAQVAVERAQMALEDLNKPAWADQLQPLVEAIRQAGTEAGEEAEKT